MQEIGPGPLSHSARWKSTQDPTDMSSISNTSQRKRRGGGGSRGGDWNNCLLGLPPKPSAWGHWLVWPSSLFLHPLTLDVSLQHYKSNSCITWSFSAAPARLHCLHHTFQNQSEGIFIHQRYWDVSGWLLWNYSWAKQTPWGFRFCWQNFLIPVWVKQCRSSQCMRTDSDFIPKTLAKREQSMRAPRRQDSAALIFDLPPWQISLALQTFQCWPKVWLSGC